MVIYMTLNNIRTLWSEARFWSPYLGHSSFNMKDTCFLIVKEFSVSTVSANCSALYLSSYRFSLTSFFDLMKSAVEAEEKSLGTGGGR